MATKRKHRCPCGAPRHRNDRHCTACKAPRPVPWELLRQDRSRRVRLIGERGHRCQSCGATQWLSHPVPLDLHHVDGDTDNNAKPNLLLICPNCHAVTPSYKGRNRGNGQRQIMRRMRYATGKTY